MLAERLQRGPSAPTELRPVPAEVAGSSPVAPVKYLQIGMFFRRFRGTTDGILGSRADPAEDPCLQVFSPSWARGRRRESRGAAPHYFSQSRAVEGSGPPLVSRRLSAHRPARRGATLRRRSSRSRAGAGGTRVATGPGPPLRNPLTQ